MARVRFLPDGREVWLEVDVSATKTLYYRTRLP